MTLYTRTLPADVLEPGYRAQLARVRRLGRLALATPGARLAGLVLIILAPMFARWFIASVQQADDPEASSPFAYTMH